MEKETGVVYNIPCQDCEVSYIGETGRAVGTRRKEHQRSVKYLDVDKSALAEHIYEYDHGIAWEKTEILCRDSRWSQRRWKEAWLIEANKNNAIVNRDSGRILPDVYKTLIH